MKSKERRLLWRFRHQLMIGYAFVLIATFTQSAYSHKPDPPAALLCNRESFTGGIISLLPDTQYFMTPRYGWFDRSHFNTGQPGQLLADVRTAVSQGGGPVAVHQGVRDDITGYTAIYHISSLVSEADVPAVALGIYLHWSRRFEAWQARPPHGLAGPLTSFAIEDLPSQYLGFYAQVHDMSIDQVFACYLGPVFGSEEGPPHFELSTETVAQDSWAGVTRLQNKSFTPLVETEAGWRHIDWPEPLRMTALASGPYTWQFVSEETWYLGNAELFVEGDFLQAFPAHRLPR